jgi:hypothetical protein
MEFSTAVTVDQPTFTLDSGEGQTLLLPGCRFFRVGTPKCGLRLVRRRFHHLPANPLTRDTGRELGGRNERHKGRQREAFSDNQCR